MPATTVSGLAPSGAHGARRASGNLAEHGPAVAVTIQYRLGNLGFLAQRAIDAISAMYPISAFPSAREAIVALQSDRIVLCPEKRVARLASASQSEPVRVYVFTHAFDVVGFQKTPHGHGVDVPFLFHTLATTHYEGSASELALSDAMVGDYVRFAATGDPNGVPPAWPAYDATTDTTLVLDDTPTTANGYHAKECAFWDAQAPDPIVDGGRAAR